MKNYYQPHGGKKGEYAIRGNTYRRIWYLIADYPYFKAVQRGEIPLQHFPDERNSVTENQAVERSNFDAYIEAIEKAMESIPGEYVESVTAHIMYHAKYKDFDFVSEGTLKKWVQIFIWHVAKELGEI